MKGQIKGMCHKAVAVIVMVALLLAIAGCGGGGGGGAPSIESFVLSYDIVAKGDNQGAQWESSGADEAKITVTHEDGDVVLTREVSVDSSGVHAISTSNWHSGEYEVKLRVKNSEGSATRTREMLLVGLEGVWYKFRKSVDRPKVNAWTGFVDVVIPVSLGQGTADDDDTISISKNIAFQKLKWVHGIKWPDDTCHEAHLMGIRKLNYAEVYKESVEYNFPWDSFTGNYYFTSLWEPCALGEDSGNTYFYFYLKVVSTR